MKRVIIKIILSLVLLPVCAFVALAFIFKDPQATTKIENPENSEIIYLTKESSINQLSCKSSMDFVFSNHSENEISFWGQKIRIIENDYLDEIRVGLTDYKTSKIELWNKGRLIESHEVGFKRKFKKGKTYTLSVAINQEQSFVCLHLRDAMMGALNEIAEDRLDFSAYTNQIKLETIQLFSSNEYLSFSNFQVWENWISID